MRTATKTLAAAVVAVLLLPALVQAKTPPPPADSPTSAQGLLDHPQALARFLHLSADQAKQLQTFYQTLQTATAPLRQARPELCQELRTDLSAATPDPNAVGTATIALYDNRQEIRDAREAFDASFSAILSPGQLAKYDALKHVANFLNGPGIDILGDCPASS
jgi:Spy/CpxP family protein refolding chaperone